MKCLNKIRFIILLASLILSLISVYALENNQGFETGSLTNWTCSPVGVGGAPCSVSSNWASEGSYSLFMDRAPGIANYGGLSSAYGKYTAITNDNATNWKPGSTVCYDVNFTGDGLSNIENAIWGFVGWENVGSGLVYKQENGETGLYADQCFSISGSYGIGSPPHILASSQIPGSGNGATYYIDNIRYHPSNYNDTYNLNFEQGYLKSWNVTKIGSGVDVNVWSDIVGNGSFSAYLRINNGPGNKAELVHKSIYVNTSAFGFYYQVYHYDSKCNIKVNGIPIYPPGTTYMPGYNKLTPSGSDRLRIVVEGTGTFTDGWCEFVVDDFYGNLTNIQTCDDEIKNRNETGIDCGGSECSACASGASCLVNSDCQSDYCYPDNICSLGMCYDGIQNGNESGIDCGGDCPSCVPSNLLTIINVDGTGYKVLVEPEKDEYMGIIKQKYQNGGLGDYILNDENYSIIKEISFWNNAELVEDADLIAKILYKFINSTNITDHSRIYTYNHLQEMTNYMETDQAYMAFFDVISLSAWLDKFLSEEEDQTEMLSQVIRAAVHHRKPGQDWATNGINAVLSVFGLYFQVEKSKHLLEMAELVKYEDILKFNIENNVEWNNGIEVDIDIASEYDQFLDEEIWSSIENDLEFIPEGNINSFKYSPPYNALISKIDSLAGVSEAQKSAYKIVMYNALNDVISQQNQIRVAEILLKIDEMSVNSIKEFNLGKSATRREFHAAVRKENLEALNKLIVTRDMLSQYLPSSDIRIKAFNRAIEEEETALRLGDQFLTSTENNLDALISAIQNLISKMIVGEIVIKNVLLGLIAEGLKLSGIVTGSVSLASKVMGLWISAPDIGFALTNYETMKYWREMAFASHDITINALEEPTFISYYDDKIDSFYNLGIQPDELDQVGYTRYAYANSAASFGFGLIGELINAGTLEQWRAYADSKYTSSDTRYSKKLLLFNDLSKKYEGARPWQIKPPYLDIFPEDPTSTDILLYEASGFKVRAKVKLYNITNKYIVIVDPYYSYSDDLSEAFFSFSWLIPPPTSTHKSYITIQSVNYGTKYVNNDGTDGWYLYSSEYWDKFYNDPVAIKLDGPDTLKITYKMNIEGLADLNYLPWGGLSIIKQVSIPSLADPPEPGNDTPPNASPYLNIADAAIIGLDDDSDLKNDTILVKFSINATNVTAAYLFGKVEEGNETALFAMKINNLANGLNYNNFTYHSKGLGNINTSLALFNMTIEYNDAKFYPETILESNYTLTETNYSFENIGYNLKIKNNYTVNIFWNTAPEASNENYTIMIFARNSSGEFMGESSYYYNALTNNLTNMSLIFSKPGLYYSEVYFLNPEHKVSDSRYLAINVAENISIFKNITDYLIDINDNNLSDYLAVNVTIVINETKHNYSLEGFLNYENRNLDYSKIYFNATGNNQTLQLLFSGKRVNVNKKDGILTLKDLAVYNMDNETLIESKGAYNLSYYNYSQFELSPVYIIDDYSDYGIDENNISLYEKLAINITLNATIKGNYSITGYLYYNDTAIELVENTTELRNGTNSISLLFDGKLINRYEKNGNYSLEDLMIRSLNGALIDNREIAYETQSYNYTQFESELKSDLSIDKSDVSYAFGTDFMSVYAKIHNIGDINASNIEVLFSLFSDNYTKRWKVQIATISSLEPSGGYTVNANINRTIINNSAIIVEIDSDDSIFEKNETNNKVMIVINASVFGIELKKGWNLLSIPLILENQTMPSPLNPISNKYENVFAYNSSDTTPWESYNTNKPAILNSLKSLALTNGFWIKMSQNGTLTVQGAAPATTNFTLKQGWNLIGYPSLTSKLINETFANVKGNINSSIFTYNASDAGSEWKIYELNSSKTINPGQAYWIKLSSDANWTFDGTFSPNP